MTKQSVLQELEFLKTQITPPNAKNNVQNSNVQNNDVQNNDANNLHAEEVENITNHLKAFSDNIIKLSNDAESSLKKYPLTSVVSALLLGIILGKLGTRK